MRNIDYIRKMRPKELAKWLQGLDSSCEDYCVYGEVCNAETCGRFSCRTGILAWLKSKHRK